MTVKGKHRVIGNGVPLPMGRAIAKSVKAATAECFCDSCRAGKHEECTTVIACHCGCGLGPGESFKEASRG